MVGRGRRDRLIPGRNGVPAARRTHAELGTPLLRRFQTILTCDIETVDSTRHIAVMIAGEVSANMQEAADHLGDAECIRIVARATSHRNAITEFARHRPDVSLVDLSLLVQDNFVPVATMRALHPAARIVAWTDHCLDTRLGAALNAGATDYALKNMRAHELARFIRSVHRNSRRHMCRTVTEWEHPSHHLTGREVDVLRMASIGNSNRAIGGILGIGEATVKTYVSAAMQKLGAGDRTHAVTLAIRRGYITLD